MNSSRLAFAGLFLAIGTAAWWHEELVGWIGNVGLVWSLRCLATFGTGECEKLWFVGMHQTNQTASIVFWAGVVAMVMGFGARHSQSNPNNPGSGPKS